MILISHRGNIAGPNLEKENKISYIESAISKGFDVEVDVWIYNGNLFLGHDRPEYRVDIGFLKMNSIWAHAKTIDTLKVLKDSGVHCFVHDSDIATLTSKGFIWVHPKQHLVPGSVCVMPEKGFYGNIRECHAICSDYVGMEGIKNEDFFKN